MAQAPRATPFDFTLTPERLALVQHVCPLKLHRVFLVDATLTEKKSWGVEKNLLAMAFSYAPIANLTKDAFK